MKICKAVIPAAGFGTRFLPATKAMPKEMLPIVDKPVIQYVVEELVEAGITDIFIVTGYHKRSIEDHFDAPSADLIKNLELGGKHELKRAVEKIGNLANFVYLRQKGPYGNGTPLLNVRHFIKDEPFLYLWSDDFIQASPVSRSQQLINTYEKYGCSVLSGIKAAKDEDYLRYGCADGKEIETGLIDMKGVIEKPGKENAPSDVMLVSGFLYTPEIFDYIDEAISNLKPGQELYYVDMMKLMLKDGKRILAKMIENGRYYDCGNVMEYLKTNVEIALKRPDINGEFKQFLKEIVEKP